MENRIKRVRSIVMSVDAPLDHETGWIDITDINNPLFKIYINGDWVILAGGGSPTPTPSTLTNTWYRGSSNNRLEIDESLPSVIKSFSSSKSTSTSGNFNRIYYYLAIASDQSVVSVITSNNENITSQFNLRTTVVIDNITYSLYEFFLDTLIPLDITATIRINGN